MRQFEDKVIQKEIGRIFASSRGSLCELSEDIPTSKFTLEEYLEYFESLKSKPETMKVFLERLALMTNGAHKKAKVDLMITTKKPDELLSIMVSPILKVQTMLDFFDSKKTIPMQYHLVLDVLANNKGRLPNMRNMVKASPEKYSREKLENAVRSFSDEEVEVFSRYCNTFAGTQLDLTNKDECLKHHLKTISEIFNGV